MTLRIPNSRLRSPPRRSIIVRRLSPCLPSAWTGPPRGNPFLWRFQHARSILLTAFVMMQCVLSRVPVTYLTNRRHDRGLCIEGDCSRLPFGGVRRRTPSLSKPQHQKSLRVCTKRRDFKQIQQCIRKNVWVTRATSRENSTYPSLCTRAPSNVTITPLPTRHTTTRPRGHAVRWSELIGKARPEQFRRLGGRHAPQPRA